MLTRKPLQIIQDSNFAKSLEVVFALLNEGASEVEAATRKGIGCMGDRKGLLGGFVARGYWRTGLGMKNGGGKRKLLRVGQGPGLAGRGRCGEGTLSILARVYLPFR